MSALMIEEVQLVSGEVWHSPLGGRGLAQWIDEDLWALPSETRNCHGGTEMEALEHRPGVYWFRHAELFYWLVRNGWRKCGARISLQVA